MAIRAVESSQTRDSNSKLHILYRIVHAPFLRAHLSRLKTKGKIFSLLPQALNLTPRLAYVNYKKRKRYLPCHSLLIHLCFTSTGQANASSQCLYTFLPYGTPKVIIFSLPYKDHHPLINPENATCSQ